MEASGRRFGGEREQSGVVLAKRGVAGADRRAELQFIAHTQVGDTQHGRQIAVEPRRFQLILAAQNLERGFLQNIDHFTAAIDPDDVDDRCPGCRVPDDRQVSQVQRVGMEDLDAVGVVRKLPLLIEVHFAVLAPNEHRARSIGRQRHGFRLHRPLRRRATLDFGAIRMSGRSGNDRRQAQRR